MSAFPTHPAAHSAAVPAESTFATNDSTSDFSLVDSHCHLDFFLDERDNGKRDSYRVGSGGSKLPQLSEVLARAYRANIRTLLTISTEFSQHPSLVSLCENYEQQTHDTATAETAVAAVATAMTLTRTSLTRASSTRALTRTSSTRALTNDSDNNHNLRLFCSAGTHPTSLSESITAPSPAQLLTAHKDNPSRVIAFGESGLDFFRSSNPPQALQYASFRDHIIAAQEAQVPLVIHNRHADRELEQILTQTQKERPYPCILHCFAGSERLASVALELGCLLSFAGLTTYPSARGLAVVIKKTPLARLLIETDSPFLPPQEKSQQEKSQQANSQQENSPQENSPQENSQPGKNKKRRAAYCEPAMLRITAEHIASLKDLSLEELARATRANFASLFKLTL